ncbi:hypothetical protein PBOI14_33330 [Pseudomonas sp. Boi14]|nr:hypothetical protein PBOI14_33330 [Pseudomonas sp. Boi14]
MNLLLAQGVAGSFLLISLIHLYWAAGGKRGSDAVIPEVPGPGMTQPAFRPPALATMLVAVALLLVAMLVCLRVGLYLPTVTHPSLQWVISAIALLMFARAIGDSELVGFFKEVRDSKFARLDTLFYSPLCVVLGPGCWCWPGLEGSQPALASAGTGWCRSWLASEGVFEVTARLTGLVAGSRLLGAADVLSCRFRCVCC